MKNPNRGRVYRRCACRAADGRQLGARCPKLTNRKHGAWTYAVDLPTLDGKRRTRRRSGFATKADAQVALSKVLEYERTGIVIDDRQTVADYLVSGCAPRHRRSSRPQWRTTTHTSAKT